MPRKGKISLKGMLVLALILVTAVFLIKNTVSYINAASGEVTEQDAREFLAGFGWKTEEAAAGVAEITIPAEFSDVYMRYNELQKKQGYDLSAYRGERVKQYTFEVLNFRSSDGATQTALAHVLTCGGEIIGGDLCSMALGGVMTGFKGEAG